MVQDNSNSRLLFNTVSITFIPGKILSEKNVWKLRYIAELRAFDGNYVSFSELILAWVSDGP
jgi:hypothetical protein